MTAGQIVYNLYHKPVGYVRETLRTGIGKTIAIKQGQNEMMVAATALKELYNPEAPTYTVYFLTGKKYWYQSVFCLYSLQAQADCNMQAVLVDDGSFDDKLEQQLNEQFPTTVRVVRMPEIIRLLDELLPVRQYPVLRQRRVEYPHLRKLTDAHVLPGTDAKLVLDSDMLFFNKPTELLQWLKAPEGCLFMQDVKNAYGYSTKLMEELCGGGRIPEKLNVGVAGMHSSAIDWTALEHWTKSMLEREGSSYLQEQALTAMLAAGQRYKILNRFQYKVLPQIKNVKVQEMLHHYVADSKYDYFVKGWRQVVKHSLS